VELVVPPLPGLDALYLVGHRRAPPGLPDDPVQRVGCALVKREYRIQGGALVPDPEGEGIRLADEFQVTGTQESERLTEEVGGVEVPKVVELRRVTREADLAPFKPEGDLVVLGFHAPGAGGEARVGGALWMWRGAASDLLDDPDTVDNLFGWEPRDGPVRRSEGAPSPEDLPDYPGNVDPPPSLPELPAFRNRFFNAYRRGFRVPAALSWFTPGAQIRITGGDGATTREFTLGPERLSGTIHWWCARGPDRPTYWCEHPLPDFACDTLVVEPELDRAYRIWRGVWPLGATGDPPADAVRRLTLRVEEA